MMFCKLLRSFALITVGTSLYGATILGGLEDLPGGGADGDYNDLMFRIEGNAQIIAPGAAFHGLSPDLVTGQGATYWDNLSRDAWNTNVGFCLLGTGSCDVVDRPTRPIQYLAGPSNTFAYEVSFQASGPLTFSMIGENSRLADFNTLGWYDPEHPDDLHIIFAGGEATGATCVINTSEKFVLFSTNGDGQFYSSISAQNAQEGAAYQHFAFFSIAPPPPNPEPVPEPATITPVLISAIALASWRLRLRG